LFLLGPDKMTIPQYKLNLSAQRALLGHVTPSLRAACISAENKKICIFFYYDGEISDDQKELAQSAVDDIISDFHIDDEGNTIEFNINILQIDYPQKMPLHGSWVYYRHEV
jgi:hypothetical protein